MKIEFSLLHKTVLTRVSVALALGGVLLLQQDVTANSSGVDLGTAAVVVGSGSEGTVNSPATGDAGSRPSSSATDIANVAWTGVNRDGEANAAALKNTLVIATGAASGRSFAVSNGDGLDVAALALFSGAHNASNSLFLSGNPSPGGHGKLGALRVFPGVSTRNGPADSQVEPVGGAQSDDVVPSAGGTAPLGTGMDFAGSIVALESVALNTGATVDGPGLALEGALEAAVAMDNNAITAAIGADVDAVPVKVPDSGSTLGILGGGLAALAAFGRRCAFSPARLAT